MVGIIDNKNVAELVIKGDEEYSYIKINPETLAKIVTDETKQSELEESNTSNVEVDANVQQHLDDKSIHLTSIDVESITRNNITPQNIKSGSNNVTITTSEDSNDVYISATDFNNVGFITADDIIPIDATITVAKGTESDKAYIKANIPDVSRMVKQRNIKQGAGISVRYDENSNDVYISGEGEDFYAGDGIEITDDMIINNTKPDVEVVLNSGENVTVTGTYPEFTINSNGIITIRDWQPNTNYEINKLVIFENSLVRCIENHTSAIVFEPSKWELIAGWSAKRQYFNIEFENTTDIILSEEVPNKDVLIINIGGVHQQAHNYELLSDNKTIRFVNPLPIYQIVEVMVMGNVIMDTERDGVNIENWKPNEAYSIENIVKYQNNLYSCISEHISTQSFDKTKWELIAGYLKKTYTITPSTTISGYTLPVSVPNKEMIEVNVDGKMLLHSQFNISNNGNTITFTPSINAGSTIDISVYNSGVIQLPEIPQLNGETNNFIVSDNTGTNYILKNSEEVLEMLNLNTIMGYKNHPNSVITVDSRASGFNYISYNDLATTINSNQLLNGLELHFDEMTEGNRVLLEMYPGSATAKNKNGRTMVLTLSKRLIKDVSKTWVKSDSTTGSAVGSDMDDWEQPIFNTGELKDGYEIITSSNQPDREGWRAMDGLTDGNSWQVTGSSANFMLQCPELPEPTDLMITGFEFWNLNSGVNANYSKRIQVWSNIESNVLKEFDANKGDNAYTKVTFENDVPANRVGFKILSSYGDGSTVGASEVRFIGKCRRYLAKQHGYYVYLLGNQDGIADEFATSIYNDEEFANHIPEGYEYYALVGAFETDTNYDIINIFPTKQLVVDTIEGTLTGTIDGNCIETRVNDLSTGKATILMEQFGESIPEFNRIDFPQPFRKLLYVVANGVKIVDKDNNGFNVENSDGLVSWVAKGYK